MFFMNEVPIEEFLGCSVGLCDWETVEQHFQQIAENCNVQAFCDGESAGESLQASLGLCMVLLVLTTLFRKVW